MKLKKIISALIIATSFAIPSAFKVNTLSVRAASFKYYSTKGFYHFKHKVVLTRPITIRKEHFYRHSFYTYLKEKKRLPAGTQIKILPYGDKGYYWIVLYGNTKKSTWVYPPKTTNWFDTYQKHTYIDSGLFHGAKKRTNKSYDFTWNRYCKMVKMGMWDLMNHPHNNGKFLRQIKAWNLKAE